MKEATGELNATVVVVVAAASLLSFFYFTIWPLIRNNLDSNTKCADAICDKCETKNCEKVTCHLKDSSNTFECVWKG